jgi:hypothetical protein
LTRKSVIVKVMTPIIAGKVYLSLIDFIIEHNPVSLSICNIARVLTGLESTGSGISFHLSAPRD